MRLGATPVDDVATSDGRNFSGNDSILVPLQIVAIRWFLGMPHLPSDKGATLRFLNRSVATR